LYRLYVEEIAPQLAGLEHGQQFAIEVPSEEPPAEGQPQ
jgi:hypothetical protein